MPGSTGPALPSLPLARKLARIGQVRVLLGEPAADLDQREYVSVPTHAGRPSRAARYPTAHRIAVTNALLCRAGRSLRSRTYRAMSERPAPDDPDSLPVAEPRIIDQRPYPLTVLAERPRSCVLSESGALPEHEDACS